MSMTIPTIPALPAGYVVQLADMQNLAAAATFALNKPYARVYDATGGVAILTTPTLVTYTNASFDPDGMWSVTNPNRLTIQTPGWYKVRHSTNAGTSKTHVAWAISTTGANNPAGSGITSSPYWGGYCNGVSGAQGARPHAAGIWPFYLYAGDYVQIQVQANATGNSTGTGAPGGGTVGGSWFSLEMVSI